MRMLKDKLIFREFLPDSRNSLHFGACRPCDIHACCYGSPLGRDNKNEYNLVIHSYYFSTVHKNA